MGANQSNIITIVGRRPCADHTVTAVIYLFTSIIEQSMYMRPGCLEFIDTCASLAKVDLGWQTRVCIYSLDPSDCIDIGHEL